MARTWSIIFESHAFSCIYSPSCNASPSILCTYCFIRSLWALIVYLHSVCLVIDSTNPIFSSELIATQTHTFCCDVWCEALKSNSRHSCPWLGCQKNCFISSTIVRLAKSCSNILEHDCFRLFPLCAKIIYWFEYSFLLLANWFTHYIFFKKNSLHRVE